MPTEDGSGFGALLRDLDGQLRVLQAFGEIGRNQVSELSARRDRLQAEKDDSVRAAEEVGAAGQTIQAVVARAEGVGEDPSGLVSVRVSGAFDQVEVAVSERARRISDPEVLAEAVSSAYAEAVARLHQGIVGAVDQVAEGRPLLAAWVRSSKARLAQREGVLGSARVDPEGDDEPSGLLGRAEAERARGALGAADPWGQLSTAARQADEQAEQLRPGSPLDAGVTLQPDDQRRSAEQLRSSEPSGQQAALG